MNSKLQNSINTICKVFFIVLVGFIPILLLFIGLKSPGIDLRLALEKSVTSEAFERLFFSTASPEINFRHSLIRGFLYSTLVSTIVTFLAYIYSNWIAGWPRKTAIGLSFTLLTLTLLPQTYLILPVLGLQQSIFIFSSEYFTINFLLITALLPFTAWLLHILSGRKIIKLQFQSSLDGMNIFRSMRRILSELRADIFIVFLIVWTLTWGNYLIPFSFGSNSSYTAVVQVASFSSHLGRDWAMICAAGFIVLLPGFFGTTLIIFMRIKSRYKS